MSAKDNTSAAPSDSDSEGEEAAAAAAEALRPKTPEIPIPKYTTKELEILVSYVQRMTILFAMNHNDWTEKILDVIRDWFVKVDELMLTIFYDGNKLTASLSFPLAPINDLMYFLRDPLHVFTIEEFHDEVTFGNIHEDIDGTLLKVINKVYAPIFYNYMEWNENVKTQLCQSLDKFLTMLTGLHYKMSGMTVLFVPNITQGLESESIVKDRELMRNLEDIAVQWGNQIRLCLSDRQQLVPLDIICPFDEYDFWLYRYEVLQCLYLQLKHEDLVRIIDVLRRAQSVYIKQIEALIKECHQNMQEARSNLKFLQLLVEPCKALDDSENPSNIPEQLPRIINIFRYIWMRSPQYNTRENITGLFRDLSNQIISFCRDQVDIQHVLNGNTRFGIKMCSMSITCCLMYKGIYDKMSHTHAKRNPEIGWNLDNALIFNHVDAFIERLHDLIDICQSMIVFGRLDESDVIAKPKFGGTKGIEYERTFEEVEKSFIDGLNQIRTDSKEIILNVHSNQWYEDVVKYRTLVHSLEEVVQRSITNLFLGVCNFEEGIEILAVLYFITYRENLRDVYVRQTVEIWRLFIKEVEETNKTIVERANLRMEWIPMYASLTNRLYIHKKRLTWVKERLENAVWLPQVPLSFTGLEIFKQVMGEFKKGVISNFNDFCDTCGSDLLSKLDRTLIKRSKNRPGCLENNMDPSVLVICQEADFFQALGVKIPPQIALLYSKQVKLSIVGNSVLTVCLDYNKIISSLLPDERKLFKPLIMACDRKIAPGLVKLTWAGELTDAYIADCAKQTLEIQEFLFIYKRANLQIRLMCEKICDTPILKLTSTNVVELSTFQNAMSNWREKNLRKIAGFYKVIVDLIIAVYKGFEAVITAMMPDWLRYVRRFDDMLEAALLTSCRNSLNNILEVVQGDKTVGPLPILAMQCDVLDIQIIYTPDIELIVNYFGNTHNTLIESIASLPRLYEKFELPVEEKLRPFCVVIGNDNECVESQFNIDYVIKELVDSVDEYNDHWLEFRSIWTINKDTFISNYEKTAVNEDAAKFEGNINRYVEIGEAVSRQETITTLAFIVINSNKLKNTLFEHIDQWQSRYISLLMKIAKEKIYGIYDYMKINGKNIVAVPHTLPEIKALQALYEKLCDEGPGKYEQFPRILALFKVLDMYEAPISKEVRRMINRLFIEWDLFSKKIIEAEDILGTSKEHHKLLLLSQAEKFKALVKKVYEEYLTKLPSSSKILVKVSLRYLEIIEHRIHEMYDFESHLSQDLRYFNINNPDNLVLRLFDKELKNLQEVWDEVLDWETTWNEWKWTNFWDLNLNDLEDKVLNSYKKFTKFSKNFFERNWEIIETKRKAIDKFKRTIPLMQALMNPSMRLRHWDRIRATLKTEFDETSKDFTLNAVIELDFTRFSEDILDISNAATMELAIERGIKAIGEIWKTMSFEMSFYHDGIYRIKNVEECVQTLEEHAVQISAMKSTRFVEPFIKTVDYWEKTLSYINECLEQGLNVQRQWLYLENIFSGEDIVKQLPVEAARFRSITEEWRTITSNMNDGTNAIKATHYKPPNYLLSRMNFLDSKLEKIQRALEIYLESKRKIFPRFYFISNDDLLEILGNGRKPDLVQMHLRKVFDNLYKLELKKAVAKRTRWVAAGMFADDGEYVEFVQSMYCDGPAEQWLQMVEERMIECLKHKLQLTRSNLRKMLSQRDKWLKVWPGQLCLTSSIIQWTGDCTRSLTICKLLDSKKPLKKLKKKQSRVLGSLSEMSRKELPRGLRLKVNALITIEIHGRDVIERMYKANCKDLNNFEWFSQLRFYWDRKYEVCIIRQTNTEHIYAYEYTGNSGRLVITPLTDRCYITLTTALHLNRGGSPKGPAGTGKTETVKDLGKALGIWVVVTNCSEGLDYKSIGKNFSGLSQSGCWGCFDEFNRINIEVLSVVAQQVLCIMSALSAKVTRFVFEGDEITLKHTVGFFITMNPGYAGRTELPDNLKSMFRPISMMVPDNMIIAENLLFSDGFTNARNLARKVFTLYELSKQQLSKQFHYDFGLRSMVALLRYAGLKRRQLPNTSEDEVCYLAMKDMNVARLSANDLPLFYGIMSDIFPGVTVPTIDYKSFKTAIEDELNLYNLQIIPIALKKIIELFETKNSRHSTMLIGETGTAKSVSWKCLQGAFNRMKADNAKGWENVNVYPMNPKALNLGEIYGEYNLATGEWLDGVLSSIMRTVCNDESPVLKWILFDGPVDAVWIENMNSVMDDNKILTLINSERITMPAQVSLLFEVADLAVASPATTSRCGMVYNDYPDWGWRPFYKSWRSKQKPKEYADFLDEHFNRFVDKVIDIKKRVCKETIPVNELNLIMTLCNLLDCLATKDNGIVNTNLDELETMAKLWFLFCFVWSVCATVDDAGRLRLDALIRDMDGSFPVKDTIYDYYVDVKQQNFISWEEKLNENWSYDKEAPFYKIIVPTVDSCRYEFIVSTLLDAGKPVMLVGGVGTGKSSTALSVCEAVDKSKYSILSINLSAQTTAGGLQESIESKTEKRTKVIYVPIGGKKMILFMDDFNMPAKECYGSQPPLELIRQWLDYKFWFNRKTQEKKFVMNTLVMGAMGPPGGGRTLISGRTLSRFAVINITTPSDAILKRIFGTMLKQKHADFAGEIKSLYIKMTEATIALYLIVADKMLPTPAKSHYLFNLRDISKVYQGLLRSAPEKQTTKEAWLRLWVHECFRVFSDRLVDESDSKFFVNEVNEVLGKFLDSNFKTVCPNNLSPIFGDFLNPQGYYEDLANLDALRDYLVFQQNEHNNCPGSPRLDLVFFREALEHIVRIVRVVSQPRGHMLNIGIGGSGRQVLTRLGSFIAELTVFRIEVTKKYKTQEFREDLKILYKQTGVKNKASSFIFSSEQVVSDAFLEIINNILSTGEANLFKADEFEEFKSELEKAAKKAKIMLTSEALYGFFLATVRDNLHIVLCFSPIGESFRRWLRQYPALINATTINWIRMWPKDALLEVANKFLAGTLLNVTIPGAYVEPIKPELALIEENKSRLTTAAVFSIMHSSVYTMSQRMYLELKRQNYVTPVNYLELVIGFQEILEKKRKEVTAAATKLRNGIFKIEDTKDKVSVMGDELKTSKEKVNELTEQCEVFIAEIKEQTEIVDSKKVEVAGKSETIQIEEQECKLMAAQAQKDLDLVMPMVQAAVTALDALSKKDITEVKSYAKPPGKVEKVMEAVMILFDKTPNWETSKKMLGEQSFLNDLRGFDRDGVTDKTLKKVSVYTRDPELEPDKVGLVSLACKSLMLWVMAIENYAKVYRIFAPKQALLNDALSSLAQKQAMLEDARNNLKSLNDELAKLQGDFDAKSNMLQGLQDRAESLRLQLERAIYLVDSLGGEQERWRDTVASLDKAFKRLPGDCLLSTAFASYIGPFDTKYREELVAIWREAIADKLIPHTEELKITNFLADPVLIREWNIQGLPSDDFSTENGVIVTTGRRWPLLVDPQMQANAWIKNMERENILVVDFAQPDFLRTFERGLTKGYPVLLQNVGEVLDPGINPILGKAITVQAGVKLMKFNEKYITYNDNFRMYITTKLSNPHYPPEISSKTTLVNFAIKQSGLQAQLLGLIVRKEKPILEEQKDNLVVMISRNRKMLVDLDNEILRLLNDSKGPLLENEELFATLQKSKITSAAVKESLSIAEVTEIEIDNARQGYIPAAERSALLFFVLMDMSTIDPMYQFSLSSYILLFSLSIEKSQKHPKLVERINNINEYHTYAFYKNTCRGLFERHKLLFSTHMCVKVLESTGKLNSEEYDFLLKGGIVLDRTEQPSNPWPLWISEQAWDNITVLEKMNSFRGIVESFESTPRPWNEWYASTTPESTALVGDWNTALTDFQKMCIVRSLRQDRLSFCITAFIVSNLGPKFVEPPVLDLKSVLDESIPQSPLIFVLSTGVDPTASLISLAEQSHMAKKLFSLSLGQGQAPIATKMLIKGARDGNWVFLANCHLSLSWMPLLDKIIETMQSTPLHKTFRVWLSSSPNPDFPLSILQAGIKMTTEPPRGIRANMKRLYQHVTDDSFKDLIDPSKYKKLLFSLCFFHTVLIERKKFLQLGWNTVYSFNDSDFEVSDVLLKLFLNEYEDTPWGALKYLIAGVNYGGHVTDDWDRRLLLTYVNQYFSEDTLKVHNYKLSSLSTYYLPKEGDAASYYDYILLLPAFDKPEAFGQHPNADIASLISETRNLCNILLSLQVQTTVSSGESKEDKVLRLAKDIESKIPSPMDYEGTNKTIGLYKTPMQVVLLQEMERYNKLLKNIKLFLLDLQKSIKGLIVMSQELEDIFNAVNDGRVPGVWLSAYKSQKPLASWARDLIFRIEHFNTWAKTLRAPALFWLAAFTFPTGFLTAVLQTSARATQTPIDELAWEFAVFSDDDNQVAKMPRESGVYVRGLFLEGGGWNRKAQCLKEPLPMELITAMPVIHFNPIEGIKKKTRGLYQCPSYYFPERSGSFIATVDLKAGAESGEFWTKRGTALLLSLAT